MSDSSKPSLWRSIGPGILFAGAAIGTSHLVQSTRAGATFGLGLLGVLILANVLKYPAFRFGPQYAAATGRSLIEGYRDLGQWVVAVYMLSEVAVMAIIIAATAAVTGAILMALADLSVDIRYMGVGLILFGVIMLATGGYRLLEGLTKVFVAILTIATICATLITLPQIEWQFAQTFFPLSDLQTLAFVIALMGFMPAGIDLSVLQSSWAVAKQKAAGVKPTMQHAILDFKIGFFGSVGLAICFLLMGAGVMHSTGEVPATSAGAFANQVIGLYTTNLGDWAGVVAGAAALFVMFTTLIAIVDGFPRLLATGWVALRSSESAEAIDVGRSVPLYISTALLATAAISILMFLMSSFQAFIDFVTITTFIVSPITAGLNHLAITSARVPLEYRPSPLLRWWSILGITALTVLSVMFLYVRFV